MQLSRKDHALSLGHILYLAVRSELQFTRRVALTDRPTPDVTIFSDSSWRRGLCFLAAAWLPSGRSNAARQRGARVPDIDWRTVDIQDGRLDERQRLRWR